MNKELLKLFEEMSALEVENANIKDAINYLVQDKNYFERQKLDYEGMNLIGLFPFMINATLM